jgi:hypothetical protein
MENKQCMYMLKIHDRESFAVRQRRRNIAFNQRLLNKTDNNSDSLTKQRHEHKNMRVYSK